MGRGGTASRWRGGCGGVEGWRGASRAPAFRLWRCGVGGGFPGALSLKGQRKGRALCPH